jgi:hypothetical protein
MPLADKGDHSVHAGAEDFGLQKDLFCHCWFSVLWLTEGNILSLLLCSTCVHNNNNNNKLSKINPVTVCCLWGIYILHKIVVGEET